MTTLLDKLRSPNTAHMITTVVALLVVLVPVGLFASGAIAWLRWGVDVPFADDWRALANGTAGSLDLGYLFTPENDTLYPVGKLLDSLVQRLMGGNAVIYQLLSMIVVLGGLLALQWVLLRRVLAQLWQVAIAFSLCVLSLRAVTYWGGANLAYIQALPVLCTLGVLYLAVSGRMGRWTWAGALTLGAVSGLVYISGAYAVLAAGAVMTVVGLLLAPAVRNRVIHAGAALLVAGLVSSAVQTWVVIVQATGTTSLGTALPWTLDYWGVIAGIVADSLLLPVQWPVPSMLLAFAAATAVATACVVLVVRLLTRRAGRREGWLTLCLLTISAAITTYLLVVAAGRTTYLMEFFASGGGAFEAGYGRFYEWWITALWPWLAAAILFELRRVVRPGRGWVKMVIVATALVITGIAMISAARLSLYDYDSYQRHIAVQRGALQQCLHDALQRLGDSSCPLGVYDVQLDAIINAESIDASFTRYLPIVAAPSKGNELFRFDGTASESVQFQGIDAVTDLGDGYAVTAQTGGAFLVRLDAERMRECQLLQLNADLQTDAPEMSQLSGRRLSPTGELLPTVSAAVLVPGGNDGWHRVSATLASATGFHPLIRFAPVAGAATYGLRDLNLECRRANP